MAEDRADLYRVILERDRDKASSELEKHKAELAVLVADAKLDIGKLAVQAMSSAISLFYKSAIAALLTLTGLGALGYASLSSSAKQAIDAKLNDWLSVESKSSIVKVKLEKIRMRTVLDSLVVRLERDKIDGRSDMYFILSEQERTRLLVYMQDPETSLMDFRDGARIISASFGRFGVNQSYPDVDQMLKAVMGDRDFQNEKRLILLESLRGYPGMYGYALQIVNGEEAPDSWRRAAFEVVSRYNAKEAAQFAERHLLTEENDSFQQSLATALLHQPASATLEKWLQKQLSVDGGALRWIAAADTIAPSPDFLTSQSEGVLHARRSAFYLSRALENGARLANCAFAGSTDLCFEIDRRSYTLSRPHALFNNDLILSEVLKLAREKNSDAGKIISAMTTTGADNEIYGLRLNLGAASIMTKEYGRVDAQNVSGTVLLASGKRTVREYELPPVYISFRTADGRWIHDIAVSYSNMYGAKWAFAFDRSSMQAMEMRLFKNSDR